jgi:hypothetical protein
MPTVSLTGETTLDAEAVLDRFAQALGPSRRLKGGLGRVNVDRGDTSLVVRRVFTPGWAWGLAAILLGAFLVALLFLLVKKTELLTISTQTISGNGGTRWTISGETLRSFHSAILQAVGTLPAR